MLTWSTSSQDSLLAFLGSKAARFWPPCSAHAVIVLYKCNKPRPNTSCKLTETVYLLYWTTICPAVDWCYQGLDFGTSTVCSLTGRRQTSSSGKSPSKQEYQYMHAETTLSQVFLKRKQDVLPSFKNTEETNKLLEQAKSSSLSVF